MALYEISRSCGHTEEIQIYGSNARGQREWRAAREAEKPCRECITAARQQHSAESAKVAAESGLPTLTGSAKQTAWAESIRLQGLVDIEDYVQRITDRAALDPAARKRVADTLLRILQRIATGKADARWWINNRTRIPRAAWDEATGEDRAAVQAAEDGPGDDQPATPDTPQAAVAALRAAGWTVAKIAAEVEVHRSTVYRWAAGTRTPNARNRTVLDNLIRS